MRLKAISRPRERTPVRRFLACFITFNRQPRLRWGVLRHPRATQTHSRLRSPNRGIFMTNFCDFGLAEPITRAPQRRNTLRRPQPGADHPGRSVTPRDAIGSPDRHRQDRGVCATGSCTISSPKAPPRTQDCRVLVLSPTREPVRPNPRQFRDLWSSPASTAALTIGGGRDGETGAALLDGVDILVATPGRLLDPCEATHAPLGEPRFCPR